MTRSLSSLLKGGWIECNSEEKRIIDTNALFNQHLNGLSQPVRSASHTTMGEPDADGFAGGVQAEILDGLTDGDGSAVIHAEPVSQGPSLEETQKQIDQMLADAQAQSDAADIRENARQEGMQQGYQDGASQAEQELAQKTAQLDQQKQELEQAYDAKVSELEPEFIDTLTGIYEHIFHVELQGYRDILVYLIDSTMRKIEGNKDYFIHVSKEDYPYVSMQKKQLSGAVSAGCNIEIVEDTALSKNGCMIETENGVFDCGVSTELTELTNRLKLLSYEK